MLVLLGTVILNIVRAIAAGEMEDSEDGTDEI